MCKLAQILCPFHQSANNQANRHDDVSFPMLAKRSWLLAISAVTEEEAAAASSLFSGVDIE